MSSINLIPVRLLDRAAVRRRASAWSVAAIIFALVVSAGCLVYRIIGGSEYSRLDDHGGRLAERIERADASLKEIRRQVAQHRSQLEASETVGVHPDWSLLLRALAALRSDDIVLQMIDIKTPETPRPPIDPKAKSKLPPARQAEIYELTIRGHGLTDTGVLEFTRRIEDLGLMRAVHLKQTRAQAHLGVPAVQFDLVCTLGERTDAEARVPESRR